MEDAFPLAFPLAFPTRSLLVARSRRDRASVFLSPIARPVADRR